MYKTKNEFTTEERDAYMAALQKERIALSVKTIQQRFGEPVQIDVFWPKGEGLHEMRTFWGIINYVDTMKVGVTAIDQLDSKFYFFMDYCTEWVCVEEEEDAV